MDHDEAFLEDMTQVSLLRILDRLDTFNGRSRFSSWAIAIATRITFNELRRREWKNASLDALKEDGLIIDKATEPAENIAGTELSQSIRELIFKELTLRQRDALIAELDGMPQGEIAHLLGGTRNNVYKLCHDARKALRRALERKGITSFNQIDLLTEIRQEETQ